MSKRRIAKLVDCVRKVPRLPARAVDAHKGDFGRVLILGGSLGMVGAPALAGLAALRGGAGLVRMAVPAGVQSTAAAICPCATTWGLPETEDGRIDPLRTLGMLRSSGALSTGARDSSSAVVVGPGIGLGSAEFARGFWNLIDAFREQAAVPVVIDADALNLAADGGWRERVHPRTVVTPHPGELARMHGVSTADVQADRLGFALRTAQILNGSAPVAADSAVVVLKGAGTLVTDGRRFYTNTTGNPGMATGGSGDVLAGLIAALIGQGLQLFEAAVISVYIHGLAGDLAARELGQISLTALDLIEALPDAFLAHAARPARRHAARRSR